jgi:hypothetical protein
MAGDAPRLEPDLAQLAGRHDVESAEVQARHRCWRPADPGGAMVVECLGRLGQEGAEVGTKAGAEFECGEAAPRAG